jgi:hypothetical protein
LKKRKLEQQPEETNPLFICNSNEAISFHLCTYFLGFISTKDSNSSPNAANHSFKPEFSYVFFGKQETISGFRQPRITVRSF